MSQSVKIQPKIKDISFGTIFFKRFVARLFLVILLTIPSLSMLQHVFIANAENKMENEMNLLALQVAQLENLKCSKSETYSAINTALAVSQMRNETDKHVKNVSLSMYNLSNKTIIATSCKKSIINDEQALKWWRTVTGSTIGIPTVNMNENLNAFYTKYQNDYIYIEKMVCVNGVIFPELVVARDENNAKIAECKCSVPVASSSSYTQRAQLLVIGNNDDDWAYEQLSKYTFDTSSDLTIVQYENKFERNMRG